jgi:hypothetical protein
MALLEKYFLVILMACTVELDFLIAFATRAEQCILESNKAPRIFMVRLDLTTTPHTSSSIFLTSFL